MSKFRVEFKPSRLVLILQLLSYAVFVWATLYWKPEIIQYQILLQTLIISIVTLLLFVVVLRSRTQVQTPVIFSLRGEWLETNIGEPIGWMISEQSRVSSLLLFIHLISPINTSHSKWRLIYKDQVTERDFRRLCRAVIYQQQTVGRD